MGPRRASRSGGIGWSAPPALLAAGCLLLAGAASACGSARPQAAAAQSSSSPAAAPPASQTGGFDGQRAWVHLQKLVGFGPRPPDTENIRRTQQYIASELQSFGCAVKQDDFHAQAPVGALAMKNIIAQAPGKSSDILLLLTHYDTLRLPGFVGADDGGSSTALMLELARVLCAHPQPLAVWIGFVDGEEDQTNFATAQQAQTVWSDEDSTYGSRELAAQMALSGDLKRVKAVLLADMIGDANLDIVRDTNSAPWLVDLVWSTAQRLGYGGYFLSSSMPVDDDHMPFVRRGVPSVDVIDFDYPPWHTADDTLDKCSPHSLAVVGHVFLESVRALGQKFAPVTRRAGR
ncbi:MAG TPA: M28 family peptidase [Candidatus Acidoferrales bacterium]|nr:M28 family peptidase [Candidatus Acidoferrales bacterium]